MNCNIISDIINGFTTIASVGVLIFYIVTRHNDNKAQLIAYIKHVDGLMVLIIENIGHRYAYNVNINTTKLIHCGKDVSAVHQSVIALAPNNKMAYYIGTAYIHDGGIKCEGYIEYSRKPNGKNKKKQEFNIQFGYSNAITSHEDTLNSVLYRIDNTLKKLVNSVKHIDFTLENNRKSINIAIKTNNCDKYILIPKHMTFDCRLIDKSELDKNYSTLNINSVQTNIQKYKQYKFIFNFFEYKELYDMIVESDDINGNIIIDGNKIFDISNILAYSVDIMNNSFHVEMTIEKEKILNYKICAITCKDYFKYMS